MSEGLDLIIVDDDLAVCELLHEITKRFYTWGKILVFTSVEKAISYCLSQQTGVAILVLDVFMEQGTAFSFLSSILEKFPMACHDSIIVTGNANDEVVNMCIASDINFLLEKPIRPYALQFDIRAIVSKYLKFAKKLLQDPSFAESMACFDESI